VPAETAMDAKNLLRTPLKPILDLLDRRVYNLAKLIDDKTNELKQPGSLGGIQQDLAGVDQRLTQQVHGLARTTFSTQESYLESLSYLGRILREIRDEIAELRETGSTPAALREVVDNAARAAVAEAFREHAGATSLPIDSLTLDRLDSRSADLANFSQSHRGFAAQAGLWINQPVQIAHRPGGAALGAVNERIVEVPFVFASLAGLPAGARVLDVGGTESTVALSLASLGYAVTVVDPRGYPFPHPNLRVAAQTVESLDEPPASFDGIVCLSTIEHIGLGAYGDRAAGPDADRQAMQRLRNLARPGAVLALTVPFGIAGQDELQRTYDRAGLEALLAGWQIASIAIATQQTPTVWAASDGSGTADTRHVALVVARAS